MSRFRIFLVALVFSPLTVFATPINLGTAGSFAILGGSTVTHTGSSVLFGNLGVSPGTAITGFPPGTVNGTTYAGGAVAAQAQTDLTAAYTSVAGQACDTTLTGQDLGGLTLTSGVYCFASSAQLTGNLTLSGSGDFVFQIGSTLTTASGSSVIFTNGANGSGVFFQVGSSATLGTATNLAGHILALTSIALNTGANITCGSALARNGAVTLDTNSISTDSCGGGSAVPEPGSASLLTLGFLLVGLIGAGKKFCKAGVIS